MAGSPWLCWHRLSPTGCWALGLSGSGSHRSRCQLAQALSCWRVERMQGLSQVREHFNFLEKSSEAAEQIFLRKMGL